MKYFKLFDEINEAKSKNNQKDYKFYILHIDKNKIHEGFEFKEDAKDRKKEIIEENENLKGKLKVYSLKALKTKDIDPDLDVNWANAF